MYFILQNKKKVNFFFNPNMIPKLHLLKPTALLPIMVKIMVVTMVVMGKV